MIWLIKIKIVQCRQSFKVFESSKRYWTVIFFLSSLIITLINCICHQLHLAEPFTFPHINGIMCHRFLQINTRKPCLIIYCREIMWRYMKSWNETVENKISRSRWLSTVDKTLNPLMLRCSAASHVTKIHKYECVYNLTCITAELYTQTHIYIATVIN